MEIQQLGHVVLKVRDDPDGNAIEAYVDTSDVWRTDPQTVASIAPLSL